MPHTIWYSALPDGFSFHVYLQPNAKKNQVLGIVNNELKIKLSAPAIDGRANEALVKLLSKLLKIPKSKIEIKSGEKSRHKCVFIHSTNIDLDLIR